MSALTGTQAGFQAYVLAGDAAIVTDIAGADDAFRRTRLDIYYNAYRLRLAEVLATDYEILKAYIGDGIFDAIGRDYIAAHPSVFRNVRWFGGHLADFLRDEPRYAGQPILADLARFDTIARQNQSNVEGIHFLELFMVALIDAALAAQNAVVALESLGLGSVYIGALRNQPEKVAAELGLPKLVFPAFGLSIGVPDPAAASGIKPRLPQSVVVHREQYDTAVDPAAIAAYDARMSAFQQEQHMADERWTQRVINRVQTPQSLNGRDRMRAALAALGFELR